MHPTFVEIDLSNLGHNIGQIKKLLPPATKFMAVVKADAYGHGAVGVSKAAIKAGADYLSVANVQEALELKRAGIDFPILILSEVDGADMSEAVRGGFSQTIYTVGTAAALSSEAGKQNKRVNVHFKVDTGMGRIGALGDAADIIKKVAGMKNIEIEGIFTHLAKGEEANGFTKEQISRFLRVVDSTGLKIPIRHAANSAGTLYHKESHLDMVRIGLSMYGLYPQGVRTNAVDLRPVLQFKTKVMFSKRVPKGTPISYGSTHVTGKETNIVTLPVGYADGYSRALSNKGSVLIKGRKFPIAGRICMDMSLVETGDQDIPAGEEVVLIGKQGRESISVEDIASIEGTINYEVVCGIGKRVPRIFKGN